MLSSENHGRLRGEGCESIFTLSWRQTNLRRDDRITVRGSNWIPQVTKIDQKVCKCQAVIHSFSEVAVINCDSVPWKGLIILHKFKVWQDKWEYVMYSDSFEIERIVIFVTWWSRQHLQDVIVQNKSSWPLHEKVQADRRIHYKREETL